MGQFHDTKILLKQMCRILVWIFIVKMLFKHYLRTTGLIENVFVAGVQLYRRYLASFSEDQP